MFPFNHHSNQSYPQLPIRVDDTSPDLLAIISRWRIHKKMLTNDITKHFLVKRWTKFYNNVVILYFEVQNLNTNMKLFYRLQFLIPLIMTVPISHPNFTAFWEQIFQLLHSFNLIIIQIEHAQITILFNSAF